MKPLKLIFQGFNSFSERAEIDFEKLSANGLFGIFGKTGSGKSTILDCIMYALYGKASRSQNIKEYVNNKSNSAFVDFTFEVLSLGERKKYNVRRTIKINKKGLSDTTASLSVWQDDGYAPLDGDVNGRLKGIIGIGYEEFSKCIILPQNEFASFVKATATNRLAHVCKLFNLEKYDSLLLNALKKRSAEITVQHASVEGEAKQYEKFTDEYYTSLKTAENAQIQRILELNAKRATLDEIVREGAELHSITLQYERVKKEIETLLASSLNVEQLRRKIELRNVAVKVAEAFTALIAEENALAKLLNEGNELEQNRLRIFAEYTSVLEDAKKDRQGEINLLTDKIAKLKANESIVDEIEKLRVNYKKAEDALRLAEGKINALTRDKEGLLVELAKLGNPQEELDALFEGVGSSALKEELLLEKAYFEDKLCAIKDYEGDGLYPVVYNEINRKLKEISLRIANLQGVKADANALEQGLNAIRLRTERISSLKEDLSKLEASLATEQKQMENFDAEIQRLRGEGEVKKQHLQTLSQEVGLDVSARSKFKAGIEKFTNDCERVKKELNACREKEKRLSEQKADVLVSIASVGERISAIKITVEEKKRTYADALLEGGFESGGQAQAYALDEKTFLEYNLKVKDYDERLGESQTLLKTLEKKLEGVNFDATSYVTAKDALTTTVEVIGREEGELKAIRKDIEITEKTFEEMKEVFKRRDELANKLSLCRQLSDVLSSHSLLNFIAEEYLSEICFSASRTLLMLSSGKYDLVYDEVSTVGKGKGFYVMDNTNCGELRGVSTLSGGETFLVSLSLALALSQAICEKTMRPVEFFFLDEGFGTLDADLTDVVLNSLEKLKGENFTIGLISHVPELKQRLQCKLLVKSATQTEGSKIEEIY